MKVLSRTVGPFQENSYLVADETSRRCVLIDPGDEPEVLVDMVARTDATLDAIWITHGHLDHFGAIRGIRERWPVPVLLHPIDLPLYLRGAEQAAFYGVPFDQPEPPDAPLAEGQLISCGTLRFDVMHVPGHSPGHVAFKHGDLVFGGDLLFAGSIGRTDLPFANPAHMEESLARIASLDDATVIHPGHGPITTIGHERANNPFLAGIARVVRG